MTQSTAYINTFNNNHSYAKAAIYQELSMWQTYIIRLFTYLMFFVFMLIRTP